MSRIAIALALILSLAAFSCSNSSGGVKRDASVAEVVEVPVDRYVPIKAELTRQVADPAPTPGPNGESLINAYDARGKALQSCNGQLEDISKVQGTKPC